jgi:hypothetical protein
MKIRGDMMTASLFAVLTLAPNRKFSRSIFPSLIGRGVWKNFIGCERPRTAAIMDGMN